MKNNSHILSIISINYNIENYSSSRSNCNSGKWRYSWSMYSVNRRANMKSSSSTEKHKYTSSCSKNRKIYR